jgi:tetratricopeptide (TPR) repeat protein/predicted Ser/Thr protein kinase
VATSVQIGNHDQVRRAAFPPDLDLSFADAAMAKGYLTLGQLNECRRHHERLKRRGLSLSIGALLLKRGDLTVEQYLEILGDREAGAPAAAPRFVLGRYRIVRELGRGGMGIVYEACDSHLQRRVALKVLKPQDPPSSVAIERFRREATIGAKLQHPHIVRILEFGADRDALGRQQHYIAMEYLEGRTLSRIIAEGTPRDELLRILEDVGRAVACAHRMGVVHRDLKPSNVIVEPSGRPVLTDFGAAKADELETRLTTSGVVIGTPAYMAPEQGQGKPDRVDARADVYALGVMLQEVLGGGDDPELKLIVLKSTATDPADRYPSAREWVQDLAKVRRGTPLEARRPWRWGRALAVAGAVLAFAAAGVAVRRDRPLPEFRERAVETARLLGRQMNEILEDHWRDEVDLAAATRELRERLRSRLSAVPDQPTARGLLAWLNGDAAEARLLLTEAEAWQELAMVEMDQRRPEAAILWSTKALEREPDDPHGVRTRASARFLRAVEISNRGGPAEEEFAEAAADFAVLPGKDRGALVSLGMVHLAWAFHRARSGRDPGDLIAESIREFDEAMAENGAPERARLWRGVARALWSLCAAMVPAWGDARSLAAGAIDDLNALIDAPGAPESAWMWRGAAFIVKGIVQTTRLADPTDSYERALGDLGEAIRRNPARDEAWMWRGVARKCWAIREFLGNRDPRVPYESALEDLHEAIRRNPGRADSWTHRAETRLLWAKFVTAGRGEDPMPLLDAAIGDANEAIRRNPSQGLAWSCRGAARELRGRLLAARGSVGAEAWYAVALADYEEAVRLLPPLAALLSKPLGFCAEALRR